MPLSSDKAAAALALITEMSEGLMPQAPVEAPQTSEIAPSEEETLDLREEPKKEESPDFGAKFDEFKEEIKSLIKNELEELKKNLKSDEPKKE